MRKYQTNLNNMITLRAKEKLIKTESFESRKHDTEFSLCTVIFTMIAKIRYHRENSLYSKNFSMVANFRYHSEFSLCSENSSIAKISV